MTRPFPTASPTASDDECDDGKDGAPEEEVEGEAQWDVMNCVEGLMEFATQSGGEGGETFQTCSI